MDNTVEEKYTRVEYERRFLVAPDSPWRNALESYSKTFEDKYLRDTRLRLRVLTESDSDRRLLKLTKKSASTSPYFQTISRILLSREEFTIIDRLEGDRIRKVRHYQHHLGRVFSIDVFEGELAGLLLCETEAETLEDLMRAQFPAHARQEVTEDPFFTGGNLCRTTRAQLLAKLAKCS